MPAPLITTYSGVTPSRGLTGDAFNSAMSSWVAFMEAMPAEMNALFAVLNAGSGMGAVAIPYTFSTTTTDSDPGNGVLRLNQPTQNTATVIRADLLGSDAKTYTGVLDVFDVSDNAVRGYIRLVKSDDATKWLIFSVSALASPSGYKNITVANIGSSAASPFVNGDAITLYFTRSGNISAAPVNFARVTVASAATTADIWTPFGNQIDWTGTTTCTSFPAAPQAGAERVLICAGAAPFTAGANMLISGYASGKTLTCAANDIVIVMAVTTTQFKLIHYPYLAPPQAINQGSLAAGGTADAMTLTTADGQAPANGYSYVFRTPGANTITNPTLAVNGGSATVMKKRGGSALIVGEWQSGAIIHVMWYGGEPNLVGNF